MAPRYTHPEDFDIPATHGGEARPRPLKSRRLVDMPEFSSESFPKGKNPAPNKDAENQKEKLPAPHKNMVNQKEKAPLRMPSHTPESTSRPQPCPARDTAPALSLPPDTCAVLSVTPAGEGETVAVVLALPEPEGKKAQRVRFHLLVEQYVELGVKTGTITPEDAEILLDAGRLCGAIRRGMALLQYGDQSARRLAYKLTVKGVDREIAARAAAYLTEKGYIREDDTATLRAEQGIRKGWGERRIREDLVAHGFTREAVEEAMESLADTDWEETCADAIRKKYGEIPEDRGERQRLIAAMMRLGYDADTIREAMRRILRKQ